MAASTSFDGRVEPDAPVAGDGEEVAEQLQQVYEYVLEGRRPEAVGATEQLAEQLAVEVHRPE
jgi:hypothetical protein